MPKVKLNGLTLNYVEGGAGHPIVFLHGHALDHRLWDNQVQLLSQYYRSVRIDLRGHGHSDTPSEIYTLEHYTSDLSTLLDYLELGQVSLVGHSLGGVIALEYTLQHPQRVATLTIGGMCLDGLRHDQALQSSTDEIPSGFGGSNRTHFAPANLLPPLYDGIQDYVKVKRKFEEMLKTWSGVSRKKSMCHNSTNLSQRDKLKQVEVPLLVVVGENEHQYFHSVAAEITVNVNVVRKAVMPCTGHYPMMENPEAFTDTLLDFLNGAVGKSLV